MSEATLEENLKSRRRHSSGWEVRLSENLPTPTNLAALKRKKNCCKTTIVTRTASQASSLSIPSANFLHLFATSTVQSYSGRYWDTKPQWGRISAFHPAQLGPRGCPESKDVKRWENTFGPPLFSGAVSCSRSIPRFVIEKIHQGQTSPEFKRKQKCLAVVNHIFWETPHI